MNFERLSEMSAIQTYDVLTALRGPDAPYSSFAHGVKWIFTQRLRYWVLPPDAFQNFGRPDDGLRRGFIRDTIRRAPSVAPSWWTHWYNHTMEALKAVHTISQFEEEAKELEALLIAFEVYFENGTRIPFHEDGSVPDYYLKSLRKKYALYLEMGN